MTVLNLQILRYYLETRLSEINQMIAVCHDIDADNYPEVGKFKELAKVLKILDKLEATL